MQKVDEPTKKSKTIMRVKQLFSHERLCTWPHFESEGSGL